MARESRRKEVVNHKVCIELQQYGSVIPLQLVGIPCGDTPGATWRGEDGVCSVPSCGNHPPETCPSLCLAAVALSLASRLPSKENCHQKCG